MGRKHPYLTRDGPDYEPGSPGQAPVQYITNIKNGTVAGFKYFDLEAVKEISVKVKGKGNGKFVIRTKPSGEAVGEILIQPSKEWTEFGGRVQLEPSVSPLFFAMKEKVSWIFWSFA
ncbi:MAG TPA: hypothetical protein GXX75_14875 [Clostridiales bacterium]|nr:hypothetical protein [Clostridiales bacterium]